MDTGQRRPSRLDPVDGIYLKVRGRWCYLYRAIDRNGDLVDTMLSEHRDMAAAQAFFRSARSATGMTPDRVTTDGHGSYPRAIRTTLGRRVVHRTSATRTYGPPRLQALPRSGPISLRQPIRSQGTALAKMEIRASRSS